MNPISYRTKLSCLKLNVDVIENEVFDMYNLMRHLKFILMSNIETIY